MVLLCQDTGYLNIHGAHVIANNSTDNNVGFLLFFFQIWI